VKASPKEGDGKVALWIILIHVNNGNESILEEIEIIEGVAMASTLNCPQGYLQPKKTKRPPK
jgi:hypothetical protein